MSDETFADFCAEHPDLFFETTAEGELLVMPPAASTMGTRTLEVAAQLGMWSRQDGRGIANDSSTGYVLPNGARRSPDASWTLKTEVRKLPPESRDGYWHLCPAFVIELRSHSDRLPTLRRKMREYIENGAQLGWLIDPTSHSVEFYRPGKQPELRTQIDSITGDEPVQDFILDLRTVWDPLA
jgi:Uma2 family endonuclease